MCRAYDSAKKQWYLGSAKFDPDVKEGVEYICKVATGKKMNCHKTFRSINQKVDILCMPGEYV